MTQSEAPKPEPGELVIDLRGSPMVVYFSAPTKPQKPRLEVVKAPPPVRGSR